jgi:hypothetical protein
MPILGLLLLLSAVGLTVDVVLRNTASMDADAMGQTFSLTSGWLFAAGAATGAIGLLGVSILVAGISRARRRRATLIQSRNSVQGLQAERDRLAAELERERAARTSATGGTGLGREPGRPEDDEGVIDLGDDRRVGSGRGGLFSRRH